MPTCVIVVGEARVNVNAAPVPSPAIRQQVLGLPSIMLPATYVVRLPKTSAFGGALRGAVAVAWPATSTGIPVGAAVVSLGVVPAGLDADGDELSAAVRL